MPLAATGTGDVTPLKLSHAWPRTEAERIGSLEELGCRYQDITSSRGREDTEDGWIPPAPTRLPATSLTGGALQCLARHLGTWSTCACVGSVGKAKQQKTCKTPISLTHGAQNKHRTGWRSSVAMAPRRNAKQGEGCAVPFFHFSQGIFDTTRQIYLLLFCFSQGMFCTTLQTLSPALPLFPQQLCAPCNLAVWLLKKQWPDHSPSHSHIHTSINTTPSLYLTWGDENPAPDWRDRSTGLCFSPPPQQGCLWVRFVPSATPSDYPGIKCVTAIIFVCSVIKATCSLCIYRRQSQRICRCCTGINRPVWEPDCCS
ncbi:uncharacterized protein LOC141950944 isoform X2 [Strix uralensis]|uniref:uncharacterized protein LOC141950944 isoform X2 n=1 Tax=Strix uralensis TaxID=36305 RepID=UPI003DA4647F